VVVELAQFDSRSLNRSLMNSFLSKKSLLWQYSSRIYLLKRESWDHNLAKEMIQKPSLMNLKSTCISDQQETCLSDRHHSKESKISKMKKINSSSNRWWTWQMLCMIDLEAMVKVSTVNNLTSICTETLSSLHSKIKDREIIK